MTIGLVAGCGDDGGQASPSTTSTVSTTAPVTTSPRSTTLVPTSVSVPTTTTLPVATRGRCRGPVLGDVAQDSLTGDFDGDGADDTARTYRKSVAPGTFTSYYGILQIEFGDGGLSHAVDIEVTDMFVAVDLDGNGADELLVALSGNTGRPGGVIAIDECAPRYLKDNNRDEGTRPVLNRFVYLIGAVGMSCAPACYPSVECRALGLGHELVLSYARRVQSPASSTDVPPLTDDLLYDWTIDTWRYVDGIMVNTNHQEGRTTHGALPVPKRQGLHCS
jgi:hypothetical protein